jgi:ABC-type amino acid transport substrate-binding protein
MARGGNSLGRRGFCAALVAAAASAALPARLSAAPLAKVKEAGVLRVAVYKDNRPWSWSDGGVLRGIDVDLAKALAEGLGVRADVVEFMAGDDMDDDFRNVIWRGGLLGFRPCDVLMHVPVDHKLQVENDQVAIVAPYYREGFAAACANEQADCEVPPPQFKGRRLAAATGTIPDFYLMGGFGGVLRPDVVHTNTGYDAVASLGRDAADVAVATRAEVDAALHDMADPAVHRRKSALPTMMSPGWDIGLAVKENSRSLGDALETLMTAMTADGRIARLFEAHGVEWKPALAS